MKTKFIRTFFIVQQSFFDEGMNDEGHQSLSKQNDIQSCLVTSAIRDLIFLLYSSKSDLFKGCSRTFTTFKNYQLVLQDR